MSNAELIKDARKAQKAVYLAGPESVAEDLHRIIKGLADALEAAEQQLAVAQAVIAEANGVLSWMPDHDGDDLARVEQDYMHRAQVADEAYTILSQSPADALQAVKAAAWDECLDAIEQNELNTEQAREGNPYRRDKADE